MPNWNSNAIHIEGPREKILALWNQAKHLELQDQGQCLLEAMAPIEVWDYDQAIQTWGVKWDVTSEGLVFTDLDDGRASISGYAETPWGPPIEAFEYYVAANPDVFAEIKYFEPGMSFIGVWDSEYGDNCFDDVYSLLNNYNNNEPMVNELLEYFEAWEYFDTEEELA